MAAAPTPKLSSKGLRSVIKVVDDKCLFVQLLPAQFERELITQQSLRSTRGQPSPEILETCNAEYGQASEGSNFWLRQSLR